MNKCFHFQVFRRLCAITALVAMAALSPVSARAQVVISQIYAGANGADSSFRSDYIELFNRGPVAVDLSNWSVQYCAATTRSWSKTNLSGSIAPGSYFLIQEATGVGDFAIPTPDVAGGTINLATASGKVALVASQTLLEIYGYFPPGLTGTPGVNGATDMNAIVDFVGYGATTPDIYGYEGTGPTGAPLSTTTAVFRMNGGCTDTNDNSADFDSPTDPAPRNSLSPTHSCTGISVNGACCFGNGTCIYVTASACTGASGTYAGDYIACAPGSYTLTSTPATLIDISGTGDDITGAGADSFVTPFQTLPFPINYYGQQSTGFRVDSNGWLTLSSADGLSNSNNVDFPAFSQPVAILAPYWDDLTTAVSGHIYSQTSGTAPNRQFIVQFDKLPYHNNAGSGTNTSQIIFNESSQVIEFRYGTIVANGATYPGGTAVASFSAGIKDLSSANGVNLPPASLGTGGQNAARQFTPSGQCPTTGACCRLSVCFPATSLSCLVGGGAYSGDGVACTASVCSTGACCQQGGMCTTASHGPCTFGGGLYQGDGQGCGTTPCPANGSCCIGIACTVTFGPVQGQCTAAQGGFWTSSGSCTTNLCAGSCCNTATYLCTLVTSAAACGAGNTFSQLGTTCTTNPCPLPINDDCTGAIVYPPASLGTTILGGNGSSNSNESPTPPPCIQNSFSRGVWYVFTPTNGHQYEVTTCSALTTYDTTLYVYSGSCDALTCVYGNVQANPPCTIRHDAATIDWCASPGTTYYILITSSAGTGAFGLTISDLGISEACPGACCTGNACSITTGPTACTSGGGVFHAGVIVCDVNTCAPAGVCCRGATCTTAITSQANCTVASGSNAGAVFASAAVCNAAGNTQSPCCYANYNKSGGITVGDIFDFLNDWFGGRKYAVMGGDGDTGTLSVQNIFDFLNAWFSGGCS
jgi:hypothetical protein